MIFADLSNNDAVVLALVATLITSLITCVAGYFIARYTSDTNLKATREANENAVKIAQETHRATLQALEKEAQHNRELEATKARRAAILELGTDYILAAEDASDYLLNSAAYEQRRAASEMRVLIAGANIDHVPSAAAIHMQLRRLGGRAQFLKLQAAVPLQEYASVFNQLATLELSEQQQELRDVRLRELYDSITDLLGNAAR